MTVLRHSTVHFLAGKQVVPVDYGAEASQSLLEAIHSDDLTTVWECVSDPSIDVNYVGTVCLKVRNTEIVCRDEAAIEVVVDYQEFKTDVTALFLAAHTGNVALVKKLLVILILFKFIFI